MKNPFKAGTPAHTMAEEYAAFKVEESKPQYEYEECSPECPHDYFISECADCGYRAG